VKIDNCSIPCTDCPAFVSDDLAESSLSRGFTEENGVLKVFSVRKEGLGVSYSSEPLAESAFREKVENCPNPNRGLFIGLRRRPFKLVIERSIFCPALTVKQPPALPND